MSFLFYDINTGNPIYLMEAEHDIDEEGNVITKIPTNSSDYIECIELTAIEGIDDVENIENINISRLSIIDGTIIYNEPTEEE